MDLLRGPSSAPKLNPWDQLEATGMERFVVTRTREASWSVSYDGETFASYSTEEEALSETFTLAAERRRAGFDVVVVLAQVQNPLSAQHSTIVDLCTRPLA